MAKHTPGPWHVRLNPGPNVVSEHGDDPATIGDGEGRFVASVKSQGPATDANARLIAAAPELLEALEIAADIIDALEQADTPMSPPSPELQKIRELIISAGGTFDAE